MLSSIALQAAEVEHSEELWIQQHLEISQHRNLEIMDPKEHLALLSAETPPVISRYFRLGPRTNLKKDILSKQD